MYTQDGAQVPISIILCSAEPKFYNSERKKKKKRKKTGDLNNKVITSTLDIVNMQEKMKDEEYVIKNIHVTSINVALNYMTKSLQRIADMETTTTFRQDKIQSQK